MKVDSFPRDITCQAMPTEEDNLVTVVIPTFNRKERLERAVFSVLDQNVSGVVVHIFDNDSPDGTEEQVRKWQSENPGRIRYTRRERNLGALVNYSRAIASVSTSYYLSLADDDWLLEGSLLALLGTMEKSPEVGAVIAKTRQEWESGEFYRINPTDEWEFRTYTCEEFFPLWVKRGHFEWSSILFRKSAVDLVGGARAEAGILWDVEFQLRFFLFNPVVMINRECAVFHLHSQQQNSAKNIARLGAIFKMALGAIELRQKHELPPACRKALLRFSRSWTMLVAWEIASMNRVTKNVWGSLSGLKKRFA